MYSTTYISSGQIIYLRHSYVLLERVFLSILPLLICPKSGKRIFTSVSVEVQYFSVFHSQVKLLFKQLSVWPLSESFSLQIVQKKTFWMFNLNRYAIQMRWPEFSIKGVDFSGLLQLCGVLYSDDLV